MFRGLFPFGLEGVKVVLQVAFEELGAAADFDWRWQNPARNQSIDGADGQVQFLGSIFE